MKALFRILVCCALAATTAIAAPAAKSGDAFNVPVESTSRKSNWVVSSIVGAYTVQQ